MFEALGIGKFFASLTPKGWIIIAFVTLVIASITAVVLIADNRDKRMVETAQESGAIQARSEGKSTTLQQNKDANHAEDEIRRGGDAAVDGCMRDARGSGAGCERFRN